MANYQLAVEARDKLGTAQVTKLRRNNQIPAVVYGPGKPALHILVDQRALEKALAAGSSLIDLQMGGDTKTVIVREVQQEPVKAQILHVDFYEVALDRKIEIAVPIRLVNEDTRPNDGGIVSTLLWELTVECLPTDIPETIDVDVQNLEIGGSLAVKDLAPPAGVEILTDPEEVVVKVDAPEAAAEPPAEAGEPAAEAEEQAEDTAPAEEA
jgi:large subunit ribosomal protein L25